MIRMAVVHPSFGRPSMAFRAYKDWMLTCGNPEEVEYLIGLDDNDPTIPYYYSIFATEPTKFGRLAINVSPSRNVIMAINGLGTMLSPTVELIVGVADDHKACSRWDELLLEKLIGINPFDTIKFIGAADGEREYGKDLLYLIVTRAWYTKFGYFLCPEYDGLFADNDMHEMAKRLGAVIYAPEIIIRHMHYSYRLNAFDATYARNNNPHGVIRNKNIYELRIKRNFDL